MIAKTGLGSSAALTSSLVGCLLQYFDIIHIGLHSDSHDRRITHNLSQLIHCNVQGSIGSGFDIASCIYGTQMYRRFSTLGMIIIIIIITIAIIFIIIIRIIIIIIVIITIINLLSTTYYLR